MDTSLPELSFDTTEKLPDIFSSGDDLPELFSPYFGGGKPGEVKSQVPGESFDKSIGEKAGDILQGRWGEKFMRDHPNIYGAYGVVEEFTKFGHLKYAYPEEREEFSKLPQEKQTRQLLLDTLEDVGALGAGRILKGLGSIAGAKFAKYMPRLHEFMTKPRSVVSNKKYQDLLKEIVDEDLKNAKGEEPAILQLIRREPEVYLSPKPKTPEQMGAKIVPKEEHPLTTLAKKTKAAKNEIVQEKPKVSMEKDTIKIEKPVQDIIPNESPIQKTKEPWMMTRDEIDKFMPNPHNLPDVYLKKKQIKARDTWDKNLSAYHKGKVQEAISEGKPVPGEVLKDYPDLVNDLINKTPSVSRSIGDTLKDFNEVLGKRGSVGGDITKLTTKQKQALARLMQDANRAGKSAEDFLRESGFDKKAIGILSKYVTQTKPLPKYAQSVNLEKQDIPDSAKRLEVEMAGEKKYQSWETTGKLSDSILANPEKWKTAFNKVKGLKNLTENIEAVRKINVNGIDRLAKIRLEFAKGNLTEEVYQQEFKLMQDDIFKVLSDGSSEIGRALNAHKKVIEATDQLGKGLAKIKGNMTKAQGEAFDLAVLNQENPMAIQRFLNTVEDPKLIDYILEYWYNSILSGPPTHAVNVISNTLWSTYQVAHRIPVAIIDKVYSVATGKERTRIINEVIPMLAGYKTGLKRGVSGALDVVKTGELKLAESKWSQEMGLSTVGAWGRSPNALMRKLSPVVSMPTRALRAMDVWANAIAYDGEMMSYATRKGTLKGLKGENLKSFVRDFVKSPTDEAHEQAMKMARHSTFMDDPDPFTQWFLGLRRVPVLGKGSQFVVPFVNTIANLTKRGIEMTPGLGAAKELVSRKMGRGMSTPEIITKQIEGAMLGLYTFYKVSNGEMTGAAPTNAAERERFYAQGKQPWAIRFGGTKNEETGEMEGGTWVSYRRIEPLNTVMASIAISYDKIVNAKDDATKTRIFGEMAGALKDNLLDSSYFQGLQQIFDKYQKFEQAPQRTVASFVPYSGFWRSMNRAYEKITEGDAKVRKSDTWLGALAQVIPGLSGKVPAELNIWGDEIVMPGSVLQHWLPYKWSKETQDPVELELARLNRSLKDSPEGLSVYPGQPSQTIMVRGVKKKLDDKVYRDYLIDLGHQLRSEYEYKMSNENYLNQSNERKAEMLKSITNKIRDKVRSKLIKKIYEGTK